MPSSASRSRTRSRSRSGSGSRDSRRGRSRSRRHSGSRDSMRRDLSRSRRVRSRYRDHGTTHHPHSSQYVPALVVRTHQGTRTSWRGPRRASPGRRRSRKWTSPTHCPHSRSRPVRGCSTSPPPHLSRRSGCT